jgi:N-methylhydantoinase A
VPVLLGVDVGGTFTDAALFDGERLHTAKVPTTPEDQAEGVIAAIEAALEKAGAEAGEVEAFAHGMTVGTNALLTGSGARTAFVATRGFSDLLEIARQNRPRLYHPCAPKPEPLVPARTCASAQTSGSGPSASRRDSATTKSPASARSSRRRHPRPSRSAFSTAT